SALVEAARSLTDCDHLFYDVRHPSRQLPVVDGLPDLPSYHTCRECGATAELFTPVEHEDGCPIGEFEAALRAAA
ncbi:MAG: hypothetical protein OXF51_01805, partial [Alphaproteobacteria bacterium]|nr:hypothetical protein [Alphaproteobacteria bacterium]